MLKKFGILLAGFGAGAVNGLLGAGGGMVLVPMLSAAGTLEEREVFSGSVCVILPLCIVSLILSPGWESFSFLTALPYLIGSAIGGVGAGLWGKHIPTLWLHRILGGLIIGGGIRYLC